MRLSLPQILLISGSLSVLALICTVVLTTSKALIVIISALTVVNIAVALTLKAEHRRAPSVAPTPQPTNYTDILIAALTDPVLIVTNGRVSRCNNAARVLLGAHISNQDVRVAIRHPGASELLARDDVEGQVEVAGLGGRDQHWEIRVSIISPGTRFIQMVDRTARYAAERARTDFVANASHELRTPLTAILGFVETLADDTVGSDPKPRTRFLKVMGDEARRMQRLIDDLISLSRIEAERHQPPKTPVDLVRLIQQTAQEVRTKEGNAANIILDFGDNIPAVAADRTQLQQLAHNLFSNALKYGRPNTPVRVLLVQEMANILKLQVSDEGEGIPAEHIPRLTERFYRVDSARSRAGGGTGLGLAIVKHIVERHRAKLEITSVIGVGTTVSVYFPV